MKTFFLTLVLALISLSAFGQNNYTVEFEPTVEQNLKLVYSTQKAEIPFCLHGRVEGDTVIVERASFPDIARSKPNSTAYTARSCYSQRDYVGTIHNHTFPFCTPSGVDLFYFRRDLLSYTEVIACKNGNDVSFLPLTK